MRPGRTSSSRTGTRCTAPPPGATMAVRPPGTSTRATSARVTQKYGLCSKAWPEMTTSTLRSAISAQWKTSRGTRSTFGPSTMSNPVKA